MARNTIFNGLETNRAIGLDPVESVKQFVPSQFEFRGCTVAWTGWALLLIGG